jgi:hypothetical protein
MKKRRPTRLWSPSIYSQDGVLLVLLAPKRGCSNDYDLQRCKKKEQEKRRDEFFNEIKPRTLPKQEWKRKEAPRSSAAKPAIGG